MTLTSPLHRDEPTTVRLNSRLFTSADFPAIHDLNPPVERRNGTFRLVDAGLLLKQHGIRMFVPTGIRGQLLAQRREAFSKQSVPPFVTEAAKLAVMIQKEAGR